MKLFVRGAGWVAAACKGGALLWVSVPMFAMAQSAPVAVVELKPEAVASFVVKHPYVVVQANSPDAKCTYCVGADKVFDEAATQKHSLPWVFARVQWSPWNTIPDFGGAMKVGGVPSQVVFLKGEPVGNLSGRPANAALLAKKLVSVAKDNGELRDSSTPEAGVGGAQLADTVPAMGPEVDPALNRMLARNQFLERVVTACGQRYPASKDAMTGVYRQWQASNKTSLDAAANQFLKYIMRNDRAPMDGAIGLEKSAMQRLLTQALGIDWKKAPSEVECGQVVDRITRLAVP